MKILLLEDDDAIGSALRYSLEREGYEVTLVRTVREAREAVGGDPAAYSLSILDLSLPDGSGHEICREVKSRADVPVIFLTAYDDEANVVMGFDLGADDYIAKPFRLKELFARIRSVTRRYGRETGDSVIGIDGLTVSVNEARVFRDGEEVFLTAMEYRLLLIMLQNRGVVLTRSRLLEYIWDVEGDFVNDNTLTVYIKRLRDKIERDPAEPAIIKTKRGMGYYIEK